MMILTALWSFVRHENRLDGSMYFSHYYTLELFALEKNEAKNACCASYTYFTAV
jgi:hypothetical protein